MYDKSRIGCPYVLFVYSNRSCDDKRMENESFGGTWTHPADGSLRNESFLPVVCTYVRMVEVRQPTADLTLRLGSDPMLVDSTLPRIASMSVRWGSGCSLCKGLLSLASKRLPHRSQDRRTAHLFTRVVLLSLWSVVGAHPSCTWKKCRRRSWIA